MTHPVEPPPAGGGAAVGAVAKTGLRIALDAEAMASDTIAATARTAETVERWVFPLVVGLTVVGGGQLARKEGFRCYAGLLGVSVLQDRYIIFLSFCVDEEVFFCFFFDKNQLPLYLAEIFGLVREKCPCLHKTRPCDHQYITTATYDCVAQMTIFTFSLFALSRRSRRRAGLVPAIRSGRTETAEGDPEPAAVARPSGTWRTGTRRR